MLKKSIITLLCIALMAGSVNYRAYAEEIIIEEEISDEEEILSDELYIKEFSIKDIAPIKLWGGIIPEYNVILSSGDAVIYPEGEIDYAGDNDVIIKLSTDNRGILEINPDNNSVYGWKVGEETLTAEAFLKKDKDIPKKHRSAVKNIEVLLPTGEIMCDYSGRKTISFDGETEYSGWVKHISGNQYSECGGIVPGGSYFLSEGDAIDCPLSEDASGRIEVSGTQIGSQACDCAVWIKEHDRYRLYKFDENGVLLKNDLWHRMKDINITPFEENAITLNEGEKCSFTVDFVPEITDDPALGVLDINDDKCVIVTSSDPDRVEVSDVTYEYDRNHNNDSTIKSCSFEICALTAMDLAEPDVEILITSGDSDNKYCDDIRKTIKVRTAFAEGFRLIGGQMRYIKENGEPWEGWYPDNTTPEYYFYSEADETLGLGSRYTPAKGFTQLLNGDVKEYYRFGSDGTYIGEAEGFQTIDGKKYYFYNKSDFAVGSQVIDGKRYLFDENGQQLNNGYYTVNDSTYLVNKNGEVLTGWRKVQFLGDTDWHYFSVSNGAEIVPDSVTKEGKSFWRSITENGIRIDFYFPNNGTPYVAKKNEKGKVIKSSAVIKDSDDKNYYVDAKGNIYKGWIKLTVDGVTDWHYFSRNTGEEMEVLPENVTLDSDGKSKWRAVDGDVFYFPQDKSVAKGFKNGYYFDSVYGSMEKGIVTVKGKKYLLHTDTGKLLKSFYGDLNGENYLTNSAGVLLSRWQKVKVSGVTEWHYFDDVSFREMPIEESRLDADGKSYWRTVGGNTYFFLKDTSLIKGFRDIKDASGVKHTYFFDKVTGKLMSGKIAVGSTGYYLDANGEKMTSGFVKVNGNYIYLNKSGAVAKKWITVNGKKYYADPESGNLASGFEKIGKNMYYFSETESTVGQMLTGFFKVPGIGQKYYDFAGSNMYYANKNGIIASGGWKDIKMNEKAKDSQVWSYYFNPASSGITKKGDPITGEIITGNAVINDDGTVLKYVEGEDKSHMYSFDEKTGARKKAVLYFHGGGYTESLMSIDQRAQLNTVLSLATFINTDRKLSTPSDMMILAGYSDLSFFGISMPGDGFPLAARKNIRGEKELYNDAFDVVKYDTDNEKYVAGKDDAVDIGDIEVYSFDLYKKVIDRFGTNNVVLMGASSGGAIALSILEKASNEGVAQPSETILYSPWLDATMDNLKSKKYSSRGVDYGMLLLRAKRVTREGIGGPGTHSKAAWFASPALKSNGCKFEGVKNITIYEGTNDPCYPDVSDFVRDHKGMVKMVKSSAGHGYMFDNGGSTIKNTAKAIMTQGE